MHKHKVSHCPLFLYIPEHTSVCFYLLCVTFSSWFCPPLLSLSTSIPSVSAGHTLKPEDQPSVLTSHLLHRSCWNWSHLATRIFFSPLQMARWNILIPLGGLWKWKDRSWTLACWLLRGHCLWSQVSGKICKELSDVTNVRRGSVLKFSQDTNL